MDIPAGPESAAALNRLKGILKDIEPVFTNKIAPHWESAARGRALGTIRSCCRLSVQIAGEDCGGAGTRGRDSRRQGNTGPFGQSAPRVIEWHTACSLCARREEAGNMSAPFRARHVFAPTAVQVSVGREEAQSLARDAIGQVRLKQRPGVGRAVVDVY